MGLVAFSIYKILQADLFGTLCLSHGQIATEGYNVAMKVCELLGWIGFPLTYHSRYVPTKMAAPFDLLRLLKRLPPIDLLYVVGCQPL